MVNPLRRFLDSHGESAVSFAARSGIGLDTVRSYLSRKDRVPGVDNALAIERATAGEVPVEAWARAVPDEDIGAAAAPASPAVPVTE